MVITQLLVDWLVDRSTYKCAEDDVGLMIVNDKGVGSIEVLDDLICRIRTAIAKCPISLDDEQSLVGLMAKTILVDQRA